MSPPELLEFIQNHKPGRAIDIGCGTGTNVITLVNAGWKVTGVDFAPRAIHLAKQKARRAGVKAEFLVKDAAQLEGIQGPFDLALDLGCFHGIVQNRRGKYLESLSRVLSPGGYWLMYGFLKSGSGQSETGLAETELEQITSRLALRWRRDGVDMREKPSAWFLFQKEKV